MLTLAMAVFLGGNPAGLSDSLRVTAPQVIETYSDVDDDPERLDRVLTPSANRVGCAGIGYPLETD